MDLVHLERSSRIGKENGTVGNRRKNRNLSDYNIVEIGQNTSLQWKKKRISRIVDCCEGQINIPVPANFWNISDWQRTRQEWQNKGVASKGQTLLWRIVNRKSVRRTIAAAGWWSLEQDLVAGAGLDSWYKTGIRWIGGRWCKNGFRGCRKMVAGSGLVVAGSGLVVAGAGKWSLVQEGGRCFRCGSCWSRTGGCW